MILEKQNKILNKTKSSVGKVLSNVEKVANQTKKTSGELAKTVSNRVNHFEHKTNEKTKSKDKTKSTDSVSKTGFLNAKVRKRAVENYNVVVEQYEQIASDVESNSNYLYENRVKAIQKIQEIEQYVSSLANADKEFQTFLKKANVEIELFESKRQEILTAQKQAKVAETGTGAGATLSALGLSVATMGPSAAMGIATTFGVASTGTAISTLTGAASTSAALAWLGGGTLAVGGGGGVSVGSALLALAGPVGLTIAAVAGATAIGSGLFASHKNENTAVELAEAQENLVTVIYRFKKTNTEIAEIIKSTRLQIKGIEEMPINKDELNYQKLSVEEKLQLGTLVNMTTVLATLVNKEIKLNDEPITD